MMTMASLPLDIKLTSLLSWLQDRHCIKRDWPQKIKEIRTKISTAIQDMPESDEIRNLLSNTYINYFHCVRILEILKETEKDTQNFFGFYSSQRMKDWQKILSLYEKENVFVAEAGHYLQQLVKYDIPAMVRELNGFRKSIQEKETRERMHQKKAIESERLFHEELKRRGLEGKNLHMDLLQKIKEIPGHVEEVGKKIFSLAPAIEYYREFRKFRQLPDDVLPLLNFFLRRGPTATVFEFIYGTEPKNIKRTNFEELILAEQKKENDDEIDFGDEDFAFDCVEEVDITGMEAQQEGTAVGDLSLTVLENKKTRDTCVFELKELSVFLKTRRADEEKIHPADVLLTGFFNLPEVASKDLDSWITSTEAILAEFRCSDIVELFKIFQSPSFLDSLVEQLTNMKEKIGFYENSAKTVHEGVEELQLKLTERTSEVREVIQKAKYLEIQLQRELLQFTKGRPVHFLGGVKSAELFFSNHGA